MGNPNVGKTVVFNRLTGLRQHVGNWPGVTVERKTGSFRFGGYAVEVIDLPGIYSLSAYSPDEVVAREYIAVEKPDIVVDVADASNIERNLYLTLQLMELGVPIILVLNMWDSAEKQGIKIDAKAMSRELGIPAIPMTATTGEGVYELKEGIIELHRHPLLPVPMRFSDAVEKEIRELTPLLEPHGLGERWKVIKLLEGDTALLTHIMDHVEDGEELLNRIKASRKSIEKATGMDAETTIADERYTFIEKIVSKTVVKEENIVTATDLLDHVLTHRHLGIPVFLALLWLTFQITFTVAAPLMDIIDISFGLLGDVIRTHVGPAWLASLLADGIIGGVGFVIVFVPNIFFLFGMIALLEDSGYLARAAFVMDRVMHKLGLHGKSFIPLMMGFGCNVPAVMATRTLENRDDRLLTILITPFASCSARLPVYILLTGAFFASNQGTVIFSLYLLGILVAIGSGLLFRRLFFHGEPSPFVMEMPPYKLPELGSVVKKMWENASLFLKKAGTIIFAGSVVIWVLASYPPGVDYASEDSLVGAIGHALSPILSPMGFGWKETVALIFGVVAKELVVGTFGSLMGASGSALTSALQGEMTPLQAYAFMVITLLYMPCLATLAAIKKETGSWKWAGFSFAYGIALAWLFAFLIIKIGHLLGYS